MSAAGREKVEALLQSHGFELEHTGGNCTALVRSNAVTDVIVTGEDGTAPDDPREPVLVGVYLRDGGESVLCVAFADVNAFIDSMERYNF